MTEGQGGLSEEVKGRRRSQPVPRAAAEGEWAGLHLPSYEEATEGFEQGQMT